MYNSRMKILEPWQMLQSEVAYRVKRFRVKKLLKCFEFCEKTGISDKTLRKIERGQRVGAIPLEKINRVFPEIFEVGEK